jgi:hypothetical protein
MVSIKVKAVFDSSMLDILLLANEVDLWPLYSLDPTEVDVLREASPFRKVVHVRTKLNWPLDDRDYVAEGQGIDLLEAGMMAVVSKPVASYPGLAVPPPAPGFKRILFKMSSGIMRPLGDKHVYLEGFFNIDLQLALVPDAIINSLTKRQAHASMVKWRDQWYSSAV